MDMMRIYLDTCGCEEGGGTVRVSGLADGEVGIRQRSGASFYLFPQINDPQHRSTAKRITERGREEGRKEVLCIQVTRHASASPSTFSADFDTSATGQNSKFHFIKQESVTQTGN